MPVLDPLPQADLAGTEVLAISGQQDPYGANAAELVWWWNGRAQASSIDRFPADMN